MPEKVFQLYIDDSGNRELDHKTRPTPGSPKWFALGGVIIDRADYQDIVDAHRAFIERFELVAPLHSQEIRRRRGVYARLAKNDASWREFMEALDKLMTDIPVCGIACVIDRAGYHARYAGQYEAKMWRMGKTAYGIVAERSVKWARRHEAGLEIFYERSGEKEDRRLERYHRSLKEEGMPFSGGGHGAYAPLTPEGFTESLLGDASGVTKAAPLVQIADLYLYPMARGRYEADYRPYQLLRERKKLIDQHLVAEEIPMHGIKYSCFDAK
jgi:hypothetical protein